MAHPHSITDTDRHFVIDPVKKTISNESGKLFIAKGDHNSERYTFEVPRYVEEHDMSVSTQIEVHYSNYIRTKKEMFNDMYPVLTADISTTNNKVFFSWLVSGNATRLVGSLSFSVTFNCFDDEGNMVYSWSTGIYESISVIDRHNNTESVFTAYPDLYAQLKQEILNELPSGGGTGDGTIDNVIDFDNNGDTPNPPEDEPDTPGGNTGDDDEEGETDNVVEFDDIPKDGETDNVVEF